MKTYKSDLIQTIIPNDFEVQRSEHTAVRMGSKDQNFSVQPAFIDIGFRERQPVENFQPGDDFLTKYGAYTAGYKTEITHQEMIEKLGFQSAYVIHQNDADFQGQQIRSTSHNIAILISEAFFVDIQLMYETKDAEQYTQLLDEILDNVTIETDAIKIQAAIDKDEEASKASLQLTLKAEEEKRKQEQLQRFKALSFNPPAQKEAMVELEGYEFSVADFRVYIGKASQNFEWELSLKTRQTEKGIKEELLSDWNGKDGIVQLKAGLKGIYKSGMPTGQFLIEKGKCEKPYISLGNEGWQYTLKFFGYIFLQDGWLGLEGWMENEFDPQKSYRFHSYMPIDLNALEWKDYHFNRAEVLTVKDISLVRHLSWLDSEMTDFPEEILRFTQLEQLSIRGSDYQYGFNDSALAAVEEIPEDISKLDQLKSLSFYGMNINTLPDAIGHLPNLTYLAVIYTGLESLPDAIYESNSIENLTIRESNLSTVTAQWNMPNLRYLSLEQNKLKTLPECLLSQIKVFNIKDNPFTHLPKGYREAQTNLSLEDKQRLFDYTYQGADGQGTIAWNNQIFHVQNDDPLYQNSKQIVDNRKIQAKEEFLGLLKKAIGFKVDGADDMQQLGRTRLGGWPDLPLDIEYPRFVENWREDKDDYIYEFIAQINCEEVAHLQDYLPREGMLFFFFKSIHCFGSEELAKVIFVENREELASALRFEFTLEDYFEMYWTKDKKPYYQALRLSPELEVSCPCLYSFHRNEYLFPKKLYEELDNVNPRDDHFHTLESLFESASVTLNSYGFTQHESPEQQAANALGGDANDWIILLKVGSKGDMMWNDAGDLFFCIHKSDLAKQDFSNVFVTLESS